MKAPSIPFGGTGSTHADALKSASWSAEWAVPWERFARAVNKHLGLAGDTAPIYPKITSWEIAEFLGMQADYVQVSGDALILGELLKELTPEQLVLLDDIIEKREVPDE